jgi:hypothetical protein
LGGDFIISAAFFNKEYVKKLLPDLLGPAIIKVKLLSNFKSSQVTLSKYDKSIIRALNSHQSASFIVFSLPHLSTRPQNALERIHSRAPAAENNCRVMNIIEAHSDVFGLSSHQAMVADVERDC